VSAADSRVRAVFDPDVLVSAAISPEGPPRELLHRWASGAFEPVVSAEILFELQEVLARPKFRRYLTLGQVIRIMCCGSTTMRRRSPRSCLRT
jgi:putative PIN family toxin of toxin-antitoxin system